MRRPALRSFPSGHHRCARTILIRHHFLETGQSTKEGPGREGISQPGPERSGDRGDVGERRSYYKAKGRRTAIARRPFSLPKCPHTRKDKISNRDGLRYASVAGESDATVVSATGDAATGSGSVAATCCCSSGACSTGACSVAAGACSAGACSTTGSVGSPCDICISSVLGAFLRASDFSWLAYIAISWMTVVIISGPQGNAHLRTRRLRRAPSPHRTLAV
jgi:hypothetical protein